VYTLNDEQAVIVRRLHQAYEDGTLWVSKRTLLGAIKDETNEVRYIFKRSEIWMDGLILSGKGKRKGFYRLNLPDRPKSR
jgi:hypothetical protein